MTTYEQEEEERQERLRLQAQREVARVKAENAAQEAQREAQEEREAWERTAAAAPDRIKLLTVCATLRTLELPTVQSFAAKTAVAELETKLTQLASWLEQAARNL